LSVMRALFERTGRNERVAMINGAGAAGDH
jgi:hypothetical protein